MIAACTAAESESLARGGWATWNWFYTISPLSAHSKLVNIQLLSSGLSDREEVFSLHFSDLFIDIVHTIHVSLQPAGEKSMEKWMEIELRWQQMMMKLLLQVLYWWINTTKFQLASQRAPLQSHTISLIAAAFVIVVVFFSTLLHTILSYAFVISLAQSQQPFEFPPRLDCVYELFRVLLQMEIQNAQDLVQLTCMPLTSSTQNRIET